MQESINIKLDDKQILKFIRDLRALGINITKDIIEPAIQLHALNAKASPKK